MRFYTKQHNFYCRIDLHTTKMYLCILNQQGETVFHRKMKTRPDNFLLMPVGQMRQRIKWQALW